MMSGPEPDPRTDGVGDGGQNELPPPSEEEIVAGAEHDRKLRKAALRELGEDNDDEGVPQSLRDAQARAMAARFDREDDEEELTRVKMRPVTEDEEAQDDW